MMNINMYNELINTFKGNYNVGKLFVTKKELNGVEVKLQMPQQNYYNPRMVYDENDFCFHSTFETDKYGLQYLECKIYDGHCPLCGKKLKLNETVLIEAFIDSVNINFKIDQINFEKNCTIIKEYEAEKKKEMDQQVKEAKDIITKAVFGEPLEIPSKVIDKTIDMIEKKKEELEEEEENSSKSCTVALPVKEIPEEKNLLRVNKQPLERKSYTKDTVKNAIKEYLYSATVKMADVGKKYKMPQSTLSHKLKQVKSGKLKIFTEADYVYSYPQLRSIVDQLFDYMRDNEKMIFNADDEKVLANELMKKLKPDNSFESINALKEAVVNIILIFLTDTCIPSTKEKNLTDEQLKDRMISFFIKF